MYWLLQATEKSSLLEQEGGVGDPPPELLMVTPVKSWACASARATIMNKTIAIFLILGSPMHLQRRRFQPPQPEQ